VCASAAYLTNVMTHARGALLSVVLPVLQHLVMYRMYLVTRLLFCNARAMASEFLLPVDRRRPFFSFTECAAGPA